MSTAALLRPLWPLRASQPKSPVPLPSLSLSKHILPEHSLRTGTGLPSLPPGFTAVRSHVHRAVMPLPACASCCLVLRVQEQPEMPLAQRGGWLDNFNLWRSGLGTETTGEGSTGISGEIKTMRRMVGGRGKDVLGRGTTHQQENTRKGVCVSGRAV